MSATAAPTVTRFQQVVEAFRRLDRREVARLVADELDAGPPTGEHWGNVEAVANRIGEIRLGLEAARRYAQTDPRTLERALHYCNALAARGRLDQCRQELDALPPAVQAHPAVLQLRGMLAQRTGDFAQAEQFARRTIAALPTWGQGWLDLSLVRRFSAADPDRVRLESLAAEMARGSPHSRAAWCYALGKARHDAGDFDGAFAAYADGAARLRQPVDQGAIERFVRALIRDFVPENLARLRPSGCDSERAIFVTGVPRSGTTLVEQILTSHSAVPHGEEANLFCGALIPAGDFSLQGALDYERRTMAGDPWGDVGRDYLDMLEQRFGPDGRVVDKTLNHSRFLGLILHALPRARVIWLRRDPEDTAISCFRTWFSTGTLPWCHSLADIGWHFRLEDELYAHWVRLFPDRILTVDYEALVREPVPQIRRILAHVGLEAESAVFAPHLQRRAVQTASFAQVREPISTSSVGSAARYAQHLQPFRQAYGAAVSG